jgi:hypothetical protein
MNAKGCIMNDLITIIAKRWVAATIAHFEFIEDVQKLEDEVLKKQALSRENLVYGKEILNLYQANLISNHIYFSKKAKELAKDTIDNIDFKQLNLDNYSQGKKTCIGSKEYFIYEHEFPVSNLQEALEDLYKKKTLTVVKVTDLIKNKCRICILTRKEDTWLNNNGYKTSRPAGRYPTKKDGVPNECIIEEESIVY